MLQWTLVLDSAAPLQTPRSQVDRPIWIEREESSHGNGPTTFTDPYDRVSNRGPESPWRKPDIHRDNMLDLIQILKDRFAADPMVYVSGNLLMFYEEGNRRKHVSPDA